jgi:hypothetical protein
VNDFERLRRIAALAKRWAEMHAGHHRPTTITQHDDGTHVPRAAYLAAEKALLDAVREEKR